MAEGHNFGYTNQPIQKKNWTFFEAIGKYFEYKRKNGPW